MASGFDDPLPSSADPWIARTDLNGRRLFPPFGNPIASSSSAAFPFQAVTELPAPGSFAPLERSAWGDKPPPTQSPAPSINKLPHDDKFRHPKPRPPKPKRHGIQLRTAARKPRARNLTSTPESALLSPSTTTNSNTNSNNSHNTKPPPPPAEDDDSDVTAEKRRTRRSHNLVEKQYRNRLNAQFERLLAVLPVEQCRAATTSTNPLNVAGGGSSNSGSTAGDDKRMSKAEVLDLATRRIRALEVERDRLLRERRELLRGMEVVMAGAAAVRGAGVRSV
jgi:hypothetical protein